MPLHLHGFVYTLQRDDLIKIGRTQHWQRRLRQLETAAGRDLDRWAVWRVYAPAACERHLHRRYDLWRGTGEWFCCVGIYEDMMNYMAGKGELETEAPDGVTIQ